MDLGKIREEFSLEELSVEDLDKDPFLQFERWFQQASKSGMKEPNAMSLATVSADGQPSIRTVLLKFFDQQGFVFYTNYTSRKSREIAENPQVALLFPWLDLQQQVIITGATQKVRASESLKYFASRPKGSQIGAWVSQQSSVITSRKLLLMKFEEMKQKFRHGEVPLPSFWGGYRVIPKSIEFWQGRENRLHDRFLYTRQEEGNWTIERLAP